VSDAGPVVAVRRAAEEGVPLPVAIESVLGAGRLASLDGDAPAARDRGASAALGPVADLLPAPLMVVSGPAPLRVRYVNAALDGIPGAPRAGDALERAAPWLAGSSLEATLSRLFATDEQSVNCRHRSWSPEVAAEVDSLLYRLPSDGGDPLVAIVGLEGPVSRRENLELAELRERALEAEQRLERYDVWMTAIGELAELYRREGGETLLSATAETIVRRLPPHDAGIAVYMAGELALGSSSRGMLGPRMVPVAAHADLSQALRDGTPAWLSEATAGAFGAPRDQEVLAVPISVLGQTLGAIVLVLDERRPLEGELPPLLSVLSAAVGFALLRDRLMESAQPPRADPAPRATT
jgi:hypothetical protein